MCLFAYEIYTSNYYIWNFIVFAQKYNINAFEKKRYENKAIVLKLGVSQWRNMTVHGKNSNIYMKNYYKIRNVVFGSMFGVGCQSVLYIVWTDALRCGHG